MPGETIYALSSGQLPSGVAIIRVSGGEAVSVIQSMLGSELVARQASLRSLYHPQTKDVLDECLCLWFPAPNSFTGEDILELHCHGGIATVSAVLDALSSLPGFRMAEPGEFSRRAFENGRLDLTELEGLSDLIDAQTETQRRQASAQASGTLRRLYEGWRKELIRIRSHMEAEMDFADEGDVDDQTIETHLQLIRALHDQIVDHLDDKNRGETIRDGFQVVLAGPPNAGKSSLLNALAKRDIAIVTPHAGTTRDVVQARLDIKGQLVIVSDTAGIRSTDDVIEQAGIERSRASIETADLVFWLHEHDSDLKSAPINSVPVRTKADLMSGISKDTLSISTTGEPGFDPVIELISSSCNKIGPTTETALISRKRYREGLLTTSKALEVALTENLEQELICEHLRVASDAIGRITGKIDVEDLLDVIFSEFCIGK